MRKLIEFIIARRHWFLFIILEIIAFLLLLNGNMYNKALYIYINNELVGNTSKVISKYNEYIALKEKNKDLLSEIARLEVLYLDSKRSLEQYKAQMISLKKLTITDNNPLKYKLARIINVSRYQDNMLLVIDKGRDDELREGLGVVSDSGVVGTIMKLSSHYSIVIPIINPMMQLSCRIKDRGYTGSLSRNLNYTNTAIISDVPSHIYVNKGDTVLTSGYSDIFPKGLMVGTIIKQVDDKTSRDNYYKNYMVNLSTKFDNLNYVYVILKDKKTEMDSLLKRTQSR